jgi:3-phosphoglycerate kinase
MKIKSLKQANLKDKKILLRADLNVPIKNGKITDVTRIKEIKATVDFLLKSKGRVAICSHLGRPDGRPSKEFSLKKVANSLAKTLKVKVKFIDDCLSSDKILKAIDKLEHKQILLLENTRFYAEEETNEKEFAEKLATPFDIYVNDAFGTAHRAHASTEGVSHFLKSYAGLLMESEIKAMSPLLDSKKLKQPLTVIVAGSKIDTKIGVIKQFIGKAENILIGGALANTFLLAQGHKSGKSLVEKDKIDVALDILNTAKKKKTNIVLPTDVVTAEKIDSKAEFKTQTLDQIGKNDIILDIGKQSQKLYAEIVHQSKTIVLNGPIGLYEIDSFSTGTKSLFKEIAKSKAITIIGGGDTIDAITKFKISPKKFTHVSTGGGAMIEFLEGRTLPGIVPLVSKH